MKKARKEEFRCLRCGACCVGEGFVWMKKDDIARAARLLGLSEEAFRKKYTQTVKGTSRVCLIDKDDEAISCIFLEVDGCRINEAKPEQCEGFPWRWSRHDALEICKGLQALHEKQEAEKKA